MPVDFQLPAAPSAQIQSSPAAAATPSFDEQYARARAMANAGQPELALAAYSALLARSPGNADLLLGRGIVYTRLARWNEAEADLSAAAAAAPDYADLWSALGNMYLWSGAAARAADAYARRIALRPGDAQAWLARARAWRALGRLPEARADLARARALGAGQPDLALDELALALQPRVGNPDAALTDYRWQAGAGSAWTGTGSGPRWNEQGLSIRHYGKRGSVALEALRAHRFGLHDTAFALDAYTGLWQGAYANLRYQHAPAARLFPANAGRAEVYQSLGGGWEGSLSDDVLGFGSRVNLYGVALGKYAGDFYVQLRHQAIVSAGARGSGERLLGRWYYGADSYLEASLNSGRSDDTQSLAGGRARSGGGNVVWTHYWSRDWGTRLQASRARAGDAGQERGLALSLYRRW
jgi:YaiO family outer membrane protein